MEFWSFFDKTFGVIPIAESLKEGLEATVHELGDKPEAAKEKAMEAVIDLVIDAITIARKGKVYEIAAVRNDAAEAAMKDMMGNGAKADTTDVAAEDFGKQRDNYASEDEERSVAVVAATVIAEAPSPIAGDKLQKAKTVTTRDRIEALISHIESASTAAARKHGYDVHRVAKEVANGYQQAKSWGFSDETAALIAAAEAEMNCIATTKERKKRGSTTKSDTNAQKTKERPSKRGEHVINNGVRKALPKIIDKFLEFYRESFQQAKFDELINEGFLTRNMLVHQLHVTPLSPKIDQDIQEMTVFIGKDDHYHNANSCEFGKAMCMLTVVIVYYMTTLFDDLPLQTRSPDLDGMKHAIDEIIRRINAPGQEVYVDRQALEIWLRTPTNYENKYREARSAVADMFNALLPCESTVDQMVDELFGVYQKLNESY